MDNILIQQYKLFNDNNLLIDYIVYHKIMVYNVIVDPNIIIDAPRYNYTDLEFRGNIRIPYYNNKKVIAIKININDIYNYISTTSLIPDSEIISGEKIQMLADIVTGEHSSLSFNPNNLHYSKKMILLDQLNDLTIYKSIFVFTHDLDKFYLKFKNQLNDKIIITHNSDHEIKYSINAKIHLAQNSLIKGPIPLPIGIENTQWFDHNIFNKVRRLNIPKTKEIYFYFNLQTHTSRQICYDKLKDKLEWNIKRNKEDYFKELASHKYAICPRGNGLDTHRIWECLYLDVIPIVIETDFINIDNLPIIVLKDWSNLNLTDSFKNINLNKLTIKYYYDVLK
jgi:hypothetical protein